MSLPDLTLAQASDAIRDRDLSPVDLVEAVLDRVEQVEPRLNAYVDVYADQARSAARDAEREIRAGRILGPLHGVPMALKDLVDVEGTATTASSQVRADHRAHSDSTVTTQLKAAGVILLGKTQTHEFAFGLTTPQTHNAWDQTRVAGGSSGGSAVAVAMGAAVFALGTDTGGSIRVPSALNGVVGLKPTYGIVPRHGVTALSWSLDHVGPITRTVEDAALVLPALIGHDPRDPASVLSPGADYRPGAEADLSDLSGLRVGVPGNHYFDRVDPEVEAAIRTAVSRLADLGARLVDVEIPMARHIKAAHWGLLVPEATAYHEQSLRAVPDLYGADVRGMLEAGEMISAVDYIRAQRARTLMRQAWARLFETVDVIAAPTVPMTAVPADQDSVTWPDGSVETVGEAYVRLSAPANLTGVPALSVPVGHDAAGLPIGMQLLGRPHSEAVLFRAGHAYQRTQPLPASAITSF